MCVRSVTDHFALPLPQAQRSDAGWTALAAALTRLRALHLSFEQAVTDATLAAIARLTSLQDLQIDRAYLVTDEGGAAPPIRRMQPCLMLCAASWTSLLSSRTGHQSTDVDGSQCLSTISSWDHPGVRVAGAPTCLQAHLGIGSWKSRRVGLCCASPTAVAHLAALSSLTSLQLHETRQLTDAGLASLAALHGLQVRSWRPFGACRFSGEVRRESGGKPAEDSARRLNRVRVPVHAGADPDGPAAHL